MDIEAGNKLIAEFMQWKHHDDDDYDKHEMENLKYHSSWDWLMPVVEKIVNMKHYFESNDDPNILIYDGHLAKENMALFNMTIYGWSKIQTVYEAVIQFIKWYTNLNQ